jgi:hypothetical protein
VVVADECQIRRPAPIDINAREPARSDLPPALNFSQKQRRG